MLEGRLSITTLEVTIGSSPLVDLSSLQCLFDKRPSFNPVFAFFSWISANFPLLNLVAIPKKEKGDYQQGKIIQRSSNIHKINTLTFSDSLHVLLDVVRRFWSKKMNKKRLRRNELIKIKDVVNVSLDLLQTIVISLLQMGPNRIYKEEKRGINIANMKNIITHEKNK